MLCKEETSHKAHTGSNAKNDIFLRIVNVGLPIKNIRTESGKSGK
jgi:hypothetical protein